MPCNSGVSLIPIVNGKEDNFAARGLYNGLVLLGDYATNSYWDHITGECVHGELEGTQLEFTDYDLLYTSVAGALQMRPDARIALSNQLPVQGKFMKFVVPLMHKVMGSKLPPYFVDTLGVEDKRRERMDLGLGLWTESTHRYYPMEMIKAESSGILDSIDGQTIFVYYNQLAQATDAIYIDATSVSIRDGGYVFDTGNYLIHGQLCSAGGQELSVKRPQQMFTRWYGFAYTFPDCEIYGI